MNNRVVVLKVVIGADAAPRTSVSHRNPGSGGEEAYGQRFRAELPRSGAERGQHLDLDPEVRVHQPADLDQ
ncbi:hypothetical protein HUW46_01502 [Amycolatopsis sp. CA-230715]|nr:hypothetical protein HUW46_01502 [Amycolatopsis sp. CA-230715]